jgi:serine/threonine protein kinase
MKLCRTCQRRYIDAQATCPLDDTRLVATTGAPASPQVGRVLGSYRLIGLLAEGAMGSIYIGAHTRLNRHVAIKVLRPELANRKDTIARFFEEARTVNRLEHPNIVQSIDLVEDVVDGAYCVLELLRGPNLKMRLDGGPQPLDSVIQVGAQIADALGAVHALDIVHRDLKPENLILVSRDGRDDFVKLIDFGVAQISHEAASGKPFGTAAYMAPEQAAGQRVDGRADLYSLGVILFEMATGRHPFPSRNDHEYEMRHANDAAVRPSRLRDGMPLELESIILRCLAKRPQQRYSSAAELAAALRAVDISVVVPTKRPTSRWLVGALAVAAAGAAAAYVVPRYVTTEAPAAHAASNPATAARPSPVPSPRPSSPIPSSPIPSSPVPSSPPPSSSDPSPSSPDASPAAPSASATVAVDFVSLPAGARVFREGETIPLGTTPFTVELPRSDHAMRVRFELAGYEPVEQDVALTAPIKIQTPLEKLPPAVPVRGSHPAPKADHPAPHPANREGVLDPFAK